MKDYEVVICGGGPAGCATALFLWHFAPALRDRILLIDKAEFPRKKICAGAIGARADKLLASIGVKVDVPSAVVRGLAVATRSGRLSERSTGAIGRVVRRLQYDAALLQEVRARGIAVRTGVELTALSTARGVRLDTSAGAITASALVGADGVGSRVRRLCGFARGELYAQAVEVDTAMVGGEADDVLCFDLRDGGYPGYSWAFPTIVAGRRMMCRGVYQLTRGAPVAAAADAGELLVSELARLGIGREGLKLKRFAERGLAQHEPCACERVLLVGEAAGIDPVLGEGIAQAIFYGRTAAEYLARSAARGDYGFGDFRKALNRSKVGVDLRIRRAAVGWIYGRSRGGAERWIGSSSSLARAGMSYFAGERVSRLELARAAIDLARVAIGERYLGWCRKRRE